MSVPRLYNIAPPICQDITAAILRRKTLKAFALHFG
jgi:hypothetical protein